MWVPSLPYKYQSGTDNEGKSKAGLSAAIWDFASNIIGWTLCGLYLLLFANEWFGFYPIKVLSELFGETVWVIHLLGWAIILYKLNGVYQRSKAKSPALATLKTTGDTNK
jgi:hypothetical protein